MLNQKSTKLEQLYHQATALRTVGQELSEDFLCERLGVTLYGAACLLFMLSRNEYCPELKKLYRRADAAELIGKKEGRDQIIVFIEDMPPFKKEGIVIEELTEKDKSIYVSLGFARFLSFAEFRRLLIGIYVGSCQLLDQIHADVRAAIAQKDVPYLKNFFKSMSGEQITKSLHRSKFAAREISTVLKLLHLQ